MLDDEHLMRLALNEAEAGACAGEAPIGALIVDQSTGAIIARAHNCPISAHDPTAHAEILALREAARHFSNYRLAPNLTLYVTLEPCTMCAGAIANARISRLVYGARDEKGGAVESGVRFFAQPTCHWRPEVLGGVLATESAKLLKEFFKARR
jgi:tRNA(Arg) A34 adenosine deaminase TadA